MANQTQIIQLNLFDYNSLDPETRIVVQQKTSEIKTLMRRTAQDIIDIGQKLAEVRDKLSIRGNAKNTKGLGFKAWLEAEFNWSTKTAQRFISVWESFGDVDNLSTSLENIATSALYLLAAPSTPESVRQEALEAAENAAVTHKNVKEMLAQKEERAKPLKSLVLGDYVKVVDDRIGKIVKCLDKSILIDFDDGKDPVSYPLSVDYIIKIIKASWLEGSDLIGEIGQSYRGWDISLEENPNGTFLVGISNSESYFHGSSSNIIGDSDWYLQQAIAEIDRLEAENPRPDTFKMWSPKNEELGNYEITLNGNPVLLIKNEEDLIIGCQIKLGDDVFLSLINGEFGLDLDAWPQCHLDPDWWLEQAKLAQIEDEDEEDEPEQSTQQILEETAPNGNRSGHLKASPKNKNTPLYPDSQKYGKGQCVKVDGKSGQIVNTTPHYAYVDFGEGAVRCSYSDLQEWQPDPPPVDPPQQTPKPSEINELYTPSKLLVQIRKVFVGRIDLDPASHAIAQKLVNAKKFFTLEDDGLNHNWGDGTGNLFLNPPYDGIEKWLEKLAHEYECGFFTEAIALIPLRPDKDWFQSLPKCHCCIFQEKVKYWDAETPEAKANPADFATIAVYLGQNPNKFIKHFSAMGGIWQKI